MKKIKYNSPTYRRREVQILREAFFTRQCKNCGNPTIDGYICTFCRIDDSDCKKPEGENDGDGN